MCANVCRISRVFHRRKAQNDASGRFDAASNTDPSPGSSSDTPGGFSGFYPTTSGSQPSRGTQQLSVRYYGSNREINSAELHEEHGRIFNCIQPLEAVTRQQFSSLQRNSVYPQMCII